MNRVMAKIPALPMALAIAVMIAAWWFMFGEAGRDPLYPAAGKTPRQPPAAVHSDLVPAPDKPGERPGTAEEIAGSPGTENEPVAQLRSRQTGSEDTAGTPGGLLALLVLEADGKEPVAQEEFNLRLEGPEKTRNVLVRTDDDGYALLEGLAAGEYPALLRNPRYLADRRILTIPTGKPGDPPEVVRVLLEKGEAFYGAVTDLRGNPVKAARVTLALITVDGPQRHQRSTSGDGSFSFESLPPGDWSLAVFHSAYRAGGPMVVRVPARKDLTIRLVEASGVNIFLQNPDATPCEGARVSVRIKDTPPGAIPAPSARSDGGGLAVLYNLPANPQTLLTIIANDARYPAIRKEVTVDELEGGRFVMRFPPSRSLGGIVLDGDGNPVANARISLEGPRKLFVRSTASGAFQFKKLPPGEYHLQAAAAARGISKRLLADTEEESLSGLELLLEPGAGSVSGRVQDSRGQPLALVPLRLSAGGVSIETVSSAAGTFSFEQVPEASYTLRAGNARRGQAQRSGLRPPATGIVFTIEKPGSLRGILRTEGPVRGYSLRLQESPGAGARGIPAHTWHFSSQVARFHLRDLPPGLYDLLLLHRGTVAGRVDGVRIRAEEETGPLSISPRP